jgi:uncharacterized protein YjbI with pentapeptide repeats
MANAKHLQSIKKSVDSWNLWREQNPDIVPDLSKADLRGLNLQNVNLKNAQLKETKLNFSNLSGANLDSANMEKCKLQEANLQRANLQNAKLNGAGMLESNLQYADFTNANLEGAQFNEDVTFIQSKLNGANLSWATGLSFSQIKLAITDDKTRLPEYLEEEMDDDFLLQF